MSQDLMDLKGSPVHPVNLVHAATPVVLELTVFRVVLVGLDPRATKDGWVLLEIQGRRANGVPKVPLDLEDTKVQLVFPENRVRKVLRDPWARWVIKEIKARPGFLDHLVAMVRKVHQDQLAIRALRDPLDHLPSPMIWLLTMTLPKLNSLELIALVNPMDHANFRRERANTWHRSTLTSLTVSTGLILMEAASKMLSKSTATFKWVKLV